MQFKIRPKLQTEVSKMRRMSKNNTFMSIAFTEVDIIESPAWTALRFCSMLRSRRLKIAKHLHQTTVPSP
eukprot:6482370-Amphidinium_carterae.2